VPQRAVFISAGSAIIAIVFVFTPVFARLVRVPSEGVPYALFLPHTWHASRRGSCAEVECASSDRDHNDQRRVAEHEEKTGIDSESLCDLRGSALSVVYRI
jgi:hypothetical protein